MKEKYGDQDDEERKLRMQLIGAKDVQGIQWIKKDDDKFNHKKGGRLSEKLNSADDITEKHPQ